MYKFNYTHSLSHSSSISIPKSPPLYLGSFYPLIPELNFTIPKASDAVSELYGALLLARSAIGPRDDDDEAAEDVEDAGESEDEDVGDDTCSLRMLGVAIGLGAGAGFAKNRASCTSVESSSPGMGSSWAGFIFLMSLRTVVRMVFGGDGDWGFIFLGDL